MENKEQNTGMSLEQAAKRYLFDNEHHPFSKIQDAFKAGASWQSSQPINSGWVSVETELPEIGEKVLVHFGKIDNTLIGYLAYGKNDVKTWVVFYKDGECLNDGEFAETITHYMPLPSPPKQ